MARTDAIDVRDSAQNVGASLTQNTKDLAATTLDAVRAQASAAGETLGTAVSTAVDTAKAQGRKAQKDAVTAAREQAKKSAKRAKKSRNRATKRAANKARELSVLAQEKAGRHPRRRRRVVVFGSISIAGIAVAGVLRKRGKDDPFSSEPTQVPTIAATAPPTGTADPTSTPSD